jgi:hypothetical protein
VNRSIGFLRGNADDSPDVGPPRVNDTVGSLVGVESILRWLSEATAEKTDVVDGKRSSLHGNGIHHLVTIWAPVIGSGTTDTFELRATA